MAMAQTNKTQLKARKAAVKLVAKKKTIRTAPLASVVIGTHNDGPYIERCIEALKAQSFKNFECIIIDDASTDNAPKILAAINDVRFIVHRVNKNIGISRGRNLGVSKARGKYILFTDGDCEPHPDWIKEAVAVLSSGVEFAEGRVVYVSEAFRPLFSDRVVDNLTGGLYLGANIICTRKGFEKIQFNPEFDGQEDRDWAMRVQLATNKMPVWAPSVLVYHQRKRWTIKQYLRESKRVEKKIRIMKLYGDRYEGRTRILYFGRLALLVFPPLMLIMILNGRVRTWADLRLLPFSWVRAVYERALIWRSAVRERFFVI